MPFESESARRFFARRVPAAISLAVLGVSLTGTAHAEAIFGLTVANQLVSFDSASPGVVSAPLAVTGLQPGESLLGIDFRPATPGVLAGLGSTGRVYTINLGTGAATQINSGLGLAGTAFGVDFNPVPNALRIVSNNDQNLRITAGGAGVVNVDTPLAYAAGDSNSGANPNVVGSAYANNFSGATTTTLYGIDSDLDILVRQGGVDVPPGAPSPNTGQLFTLGLLGFDTSDLVGFDISEDSGFAFASLTSPATGVSQFHVVDLTTGAAIFVGTIGAPGAAAPTALRGISVFNGPSAVPEPGTLGLVGLAAGLLGWAWRRRERD